MAERVGYPGQEKGHRGRKGDGGECIEVLGGTQDLHGAEGQDFPT